MGRLLPVFINLHFEISMKIRNLLFASTFASAAFAQERPNIVLFLVDDMGWQDTSVPFFSEPTRWNQIFHTPNMERLAAKGMKFTQAYACPVSSPSRVSLLTGANVTQHHVTNWTLHKNRPTDSKSDSLLFPGWNFNGMSPVPEIEHSFYATPLPRLLKEVGYKTVMVGKAHFGALTTPAEDPLALGFDINIGGHAAGGPGSYLGSRSFGKDRPAQEAAIYAIPHLEAYHGQDIFLTEALTREAIKAMEGSLHAKQPFFLYMSHYAVHTPYEVDSRFYPKYKAMGLEEQEARYASIVEGMDKSLGDIMDFLTRKGIEKNTIILFMSDNGGYTVGVRANTHGGEPKNSPLRGGKGACFEGGIREPMIVSWEGVTQPGASNSSPVIIEDFFPTILKMAGIRNQKTVQQIDGIDFSKALRGQTINENRSLYFHYPNRWGEKYGDIGVPQSAIRVGNWKLIYYYEEEKIELYNLASDISEKENLAGSEACQKVVQNLARQLSNRLRSQGSPIPLRRSGGEKARYPDQI